jgi:iron complex transport system substrate-binding protein
MNSLCRIALVLLLFALAGCGQTPTPTRAKTTPAAGFPLTLTDAQGVSVTLPVRPERIVSVSPTITEMLFAIGAGDRVVAVTNQCDYPPEVKRLNKVGLWFTPSAEKALGARPDLVIGQQGNPPEFIGALRKSGCPVFTTLEPVSLADIHAQLRRLGQLTGARDGAERVIARMQQRLAAVERRIAEVPEDRRPTAFIFLQIGPVWTAGSGTFQDEAIGAAGARNAGSRVKGFKEFSLEHLVAADPDFLLVATMTGDPDMMKRQVLSHSVLKRLTAVRRGRLVMLEEDEIMRAGPRIVSAIEAMAKAFYPGRFSSSATSAR